MVSTGPPPAGRPGRPGLSRRALLGGTLLAGAGVAAGVAGTREISRWCGWDRPPVSGGYAAAADNLGAVRNGGVTIHYFLPTGEPLVAFTFDDGPAPHWTPMVLDALDEAKVPATFFLVGRTLTENPGILRGRLARHEVGNHSWSHADLATLNLGQVSDELHRTHDAIREHTGRTPTLMRPPFGHIGGSTVLAADEIGYDIALWSHEMHEHRFRGNPAAQAHDIVETVRPGSIVLAHDAGDERRLVTVHGLPAMVAGLQARGFRFVTVSELIAAAAATATPLMH